MERDEGEGRMRGGARSRGATAALPWPGRTLPSAEWASRLAAWLGRQWAVEQEGRRLFLWLPACMGFGILLYFAATAEPDLWAPVAAACLFTGAAFATRIRAGVAFRVHLSLAMVFMGFSAATLRTASVAAPVLDQPRVLRLTAVVEAVDIRTGGGRLLLRPLSAEGIAPENLPFRVRVTTPGLPSVRAGDTVAATARLLPPPEPSRPGGYDFAREAFFARIGAVGSITGKIELATVPAGAEPSWWLRFNAAVDRSRNMLTQRIAESIGGPAGAVAASLVTGKRGLISETTNEDLRAAGIYHVVSISGLHMVLAAGMVFWSIRAAFALSPGLTLHFPVKKWAAVAAMAAAFAYNVFAGSEIATQRSLVMTLVLLGATLADRPALSMRNLAVAALLVLALEPESLLGPSFQMSFGAVAALIALFERSGRGPPEPESLGLTGLGQSRDPPPAPVGPVLRYVLAGRRHVVTVILTTLVAEAATAPFGLFHFQRFTPYGLVGNALTLPLVSFIVMPAAVLGIVAIPFGLDAPVWRLMGLGIDGMLRVSAMVAGWEGSLKSIPAFAPPALAALSLALLFATLWRSALRWAAVPLAALGVVMAGAEKQPDLVASRDGMALAVRGVEGRLAVVGRRPGSFVVEQWLRADGDLRAVDDPGVFAGPRCDAWGCVARLPDGRAVSQIVKPDAFEEDCRRAHVVVTPLVAPAFCKPPVLIDKRVLDAGGAVTLVPNGAGVDTTVSGGRGAPAYALVTQRSLALDRPWLPKPRSAPPTTARAEPPETSPDQPDRIEPVR